MGAHGRVGLRAHRNTIAACILSAAAVLPVCLEAGEYLHPVVVTCLGDSVTHGAPWGADDSETYPAQLAVLLDSAYPSKVCEVHNRGVNGATADTLLAKLNSEGFPEQPDFVLLMIGGNDLSAAEDLDDFLNNVLPQTLSEVQQCVDLVKAHTNHDGKHPRVLLSAFTPNRIGDVGGFDANLGIQVYNANLASIEGVELYFTANFSDLYDSAEGKAKAELMSDLVHPNEDGYAVIAENWFDVIAAFPPMVDTDGDGLWDEEETDCGTDLELPDSDADGIGDLVELACADASTAMVYAKRPGAVRVNFQPPRLVSPSGFAPDGGFPPVTGSPFGWN
jgi:lysophospholipase L1-like esterase